MSHTHHRIEHEADVGALVAAPKLNKENWVADGDHEEHRKAAWAELFFDLAYVAAGVKLGSNLKYNVGFWGIVEFVLLFTGMLRCWFSITMLYNRFQLKDVVSRVFFLAVFASTVNAAVHLDDGLGDHGPGHFTSLAIINLLLATMMRYIGNWIERVDRLTQVEAGMFIFSAIYHLVCGWLPLFIFDDDPAGKTNRKTMRGIMAVVDYLGWLFHFTIMFKFLRPAKYDEQGNVVRPPDRVPLHIDLLNERFCLLIVIVLGEGVLGIIVPEVAESWKQADSYAVYCTTAAMATVVLGGLQFLYFEVDNLRFEVHALQRTLQEGTELLWCLGGCIPIHTGTMWMHVHVFLMNCNLIVGVGIKCALSYNIKLKQKYRVFFAGAVAVSMLLSLLVHHTHRLPKFQESRRNRNIIRVVAAALIFASAFLPYEDVEAWAFMSIVAFIMVLVNLYEFMAAQITNTSKFARAQEAASIRESEEAASKEQPADPEGGLHIDRIVPGVDDGETPAAEQKSQEAKPWYAVGDRLRARSKQLSSIGIRESYRDIHDANNDFH